jgi:hypothetical protein
MLDPTYLELKEKESKKGREKGDHGRSDSITMFDMIQNPVEIQKYC